MEGEGENEDGSRRRGQHLATTVDDATSVSPGCAEVVCESSEVCAFDVMDRVEVDRRSQACRPVSRMQAHDCLVDHSMTPTTRRPLHAQETVSL